MRRMDFRSLVDLYALALVAVARDESRQGCSLALAERREASANALREVRLRLAAAARARGVNAAS